MGRRLKAGTGGLVAALALVVGAPGQAWAKAGSRTQPSGYDVSWPQCGKALPGSRLFGVVGVSDGLAFSDNPCLATQYRWAAGAGSPPAFYLNTANPGSASTHWALPGPKPCSGVSSDAGCAYNYGWNAAAHAFAYAGAQTSAAGTHAWWLDIETGNSWSTSTTLNAADIQGMLDYFASRSVAAGVYSTSYQWTQIAGAMRPAVPSWLAGASTSAQALSWCGGASFTAGRVALVQFPNNGLDGDVAC